MFSVLSAIFWLMVYLFLILAPPLTLLIGPVPSGSGFWWDFSMALGFFSLSIMGMQFLLTARFRYACAPFGIDIIYYFHRYLAVIVLALTFLHFLIIYLNDQTILDMINPQHAPWYMTAGYSAFILLVLLISTSLWRKKLHIPYDQWRILHIFLAVTAFLLARAHIEGVGYYINAHEKKWLWNSYTLFWLFLIVYIRLIKPWLMFQKPYRVVEVRQERGSSWTLALEPDGHEGKDFKPGQFTWLTLRNSPWHLKEHPFSFSSSADHKERVTFTIKELGDFTRTIKDTKVSEIAYLDDPQGVFTIDLYPKSLGFVFIAGGIGAAPIMSMLQTLADRHDQRQLLFIYGNNHWENVTFRDELESLKTKLNLNLIHVLKEPPIDWKGETGLITNELLVKTIPKDAKKYEYFICGPGLMSNNIQRSLGLLGIPLGQIHFELFDMI